MPTTAPKKNVMFVDDDQFVLDSLRDALRSERGRWKMVFVSSGREALARLAEERFEVVVADMRMPAMDGAALLAEVGTQQPGAVRIVLSGYTELDAALRAASVAHLFLAKPCPTRVLSGTIERALGLRELLASSGLLLSLGQASTLPSVPAVYRRLTETLEDPAAGPEEVAAILEQDMAMCAKVLQLVNSAFFGHGQSVTSVPQAVSYLGIPTLKTLTLSASAFQAFEPASSNFSIEGLQQHSLLVARIASRIADDAGLTDDLLAASLLHDIGKLVRASQAPEAFTDRLAAATREGTPMFRVEEREDHVTHAEIGAYLLGVWGLPHGLMESVAHHHRPARVEHARLEPFVVVHIADALAHELDPAGEAIPEIDEDDLARLGFAGHLPSWRILAAAERDPAREPLRSHAPGDPPGSGPTGGS
jgi:putative nucleotidyltransferase with HDIG domain